MTCPGCNNDMENGALYVRGVGGALFWSADKDVAFISRSGLDQIDLGAISMKPTGAQAVVESWRCSDCGMVVFGSRGG